MRMTKTKRIASLILTLVMLLSYFPVTAWAVDASTDIKAIQKPSGLSIVEDYDDYFGDGWEEKLGLPTSVTVTLADDTTAEVPVTWDTAVLDTRTPGYYYLPGTVALPTGVTNGQNLAVSITIQVREKVNLISNPSFENGRIGWGLGYSFLKDGTPAAEGNYALQLQSSPTAKSTFHALMTSAEESTKLAQKIAAEGYGQYYISAQMRDYLYDGETQHADPLRAYVSLSYMTQDITTAVDKSQKGNVITLSDEYQTTGTVLELSSEENWYRLNLYVVSDTKFANQWILADDVQLVPLNVPLKAEPSAITEVKTQIQSRFVTVNYDKYVGENWKESLGLPETVEVLTDKGDTVQIGVIWNYAGLDVTKLGRYTLTGTLDDSGFPNPKGLTVQQHIYVRNSENLFTNPSFEEGVSSWGFGYYYLVDGVPAAVGSKALQLQTNVSSRFSQNALYNKNSEELAAKIAAQGAGQYYLSAQVRDYLYQGAVPEVQHTDSLQTYMQFIYKTDISSTSTNLLAETHRVTLSMDEYVTTSGVITVNGDEKWVRADLYIASATKFAAQWVMVDDMQLIPLNVLIPLGEEPAEIREILDEIPIRAVAQNYDKYVGENWKDALGLPKTVLVGTANGAKAEVDVIWDYTPLNLSKVGKYVLTGKLDDSSYPNPSNLYVTQEIYIREYKNLVTNGSFETGTTDWGCGWSFKKFLTPAADGKVALGAQSSEKARTLFHIFYSSNTEALAAKVADTGAGQYYLSAQLRDYTESGEIPHKDPLKMYMNVSTMNGSSTSVTSKNNTNTLTLNKTYQQASSVFNLNGDETWVRINAYLTSNTEFSSQWIMVDKIELVALNVVVERYEGAMEEVQTIIPGRKIIQNYPDYIGAEYSTADLMFPETVEVLTTVGQIIKVGVKWNYSTLDLTKVGKYTVVGTLEDIKIANPNGLTVDQVVNVVPYKNLLSNPSFESHGDHWLADGNVTTEAGITSPVKDGKLSLKMTVGRLEGFGRNWIQSLYLNNPNNVGLWVTTQGGGRYYFSGWACGTANSTDVQVYTRLWYMHFASGDAYVNQTGSVVSLSADEYRQSSAIVELPDDIYWSRLDFYLSGTASALRNSILYLDNMELVPLNVEVPSMTDIIACETVADPYVHEGTNFDGLNLPEALQITTKNGQKFQVPVKWDTNAYDPHKIGVQTITGQLELGNRYKNPKNFVPTATIYVRAKGEDLRQTIYISNDGSEDNDGLSPKTPKKEITNLPSYLASGYNVKLNKGDIWYIPTATMTLTNFHGTEEAPLTVGSYGSGELPTIAFMRKIENSAWRLVDQKRNVYATDVTSFGQYQGESVHRCFVADEAYFHLSRTNYVTLKEKEFCSYGNTLYVRMPEGETPHDVEITPVGSGTIRMKIQNVSYLTFEHLHIKGGSSIFPVIRMDAPTKYVKFQYVNMTHTWYYNILLETDDEDTHYKPEFSHMYMDTMLCEKEGAVSGYDSHYWNPHTIEGITMHDGVDGAWIHDCHMRNMSHAFVCMETLDETKESKTTGIRNCIVEDNLFEGANALYARPFIILNKLNLSGTKMCHHNIFRRNKCYDMTVSSHLFGDDILIYSNLISYSHTTYNEDGTLFDGKGAQPWGFDTVTWGSVEGCVGSILVNNTFYDVAGAIAVYDPTNHVYNNLYANNLVVNWKSDPNGGHGEAGAFADETAQFNHFMNNGLYSHTGASDHFMVDKKIYSTDDVNVSVAGYSGNIYADPKFATVDLTLLGKGVRQDFTLSNESPMRYAGLSLYHSVYENFSMWKYLKEEYTDINGVAYLAESPSIGAWSFSELITGDVAEVGQLPEIIIRPGASFEDLTLPDTVSAVNDKGIDVVLLVTWSDANFDSSKPGTITLTGELRNGPHTNLNIKGKTATINVNIKDKLELLSITTVVDMLTVLYGTSQEDAVAQLPDKLYVVEESGFEEYLPVTWTCMDYKPNVPGDYTFKCVFPENMLTNAREFDLEVTVRVMHEIGRGVELLINSDFIDGTSAAPWKIGWCTGATGNFRVTKDPQYLPEGEPAAAIVTVTRRYASIQQDVTGQVKLMGDGTYLYKVLMRAYDPAEPIDTSTPVLSVDGTRSVMYSCRARTNIGTEYVEFYSLMNLTDVEDAQSVIFHTSTYKSRDDAEDGPRSYIIAGCSLVYLGNTDAEVEATLDSIDLTWNTIKGENGFNTDSIMSNLKLPTSIGAGSKIKWSSSDESTISKDGKVTMGRVSKTVTLTATITYNGIETVKKFTVTVPRDPELPAFTGSLSGGQTVTEGDEFKVTISLKSDKATSFNAYRFILSFNTSKLEYIGISDSASIVEIDGGKIVISGVGTERPITDTITVTFRAKKHGMTEVKLVQAEMDIDPNASLDNLPIMTVTEGTALIDIQKISITNDATTADPAQNTSVVIYIVIGLAVAALIAGGVIVTILIKKKRSIPTEE